MLKDQANVYSMKVSEKPEIKPEVRHLPMRLEPARLQPVEDSGEPGTGEICQLCVWLYPVHVVTLETFNVEDMVVFLDFNVICSINFHMFYSVQGVSQSMTIY